jgi:hypothetical protein
MINKMQYNEFEEQYKINRIKEILATSIRAIQRNSNLKARASVGLSLDSKKYPRGGVFRSVTPVNHPNITFASKDN